MKKAVIWTFVVLGAVVLLVLAGVAGYLAYNTASIHLTARNICHKGGNELQLQESKDQSAEGSCPEDWSRFGDFCLVYKSSQKSWNDSEADCKLEGGHLASVHSAGEDCLIRKLIEEGNPDLHESLPSTWLGFTDEGREGDWYWSDGTLVDYQQWGDSEPNSFRGKPENCAALLWFANAYSWHDFTCEPRQGYICKVPVKL